MSEVLAFLAGVVISAFIAVFVVSTISITGEEINKAIQKCPKHQIVNMTFDGRFQ